MSCHVQGQKTRAMTGGNTKHSLLTWLAVVKTTTYLNMNFSILRQHSSDQHYQESFRVFFSSIIKAPEHKY